MLTPSISRLILAQCVRTLTFAGPIFTLFLLAKGLSLQQIFTLSSIILLSGMFFEVPTGILADRYGRKKSLILGACISTMGWVLWLFVDTFIGFALIFGLFGLANAFWSGTDEALIYDELKSIGREQDAQKVFSRYSGALAVAFAVAAFVGGFLARVHTLENFYLLFQLTCISSFLGLLLTLTLREPVKSTAAGKELEHKEESILRQFGSGVRLLTKNKRLRKITFFSIFTLSFALMETYQVYFVRSDVPASWYGYVLGVSSLLIAVVKWYAYKLEEWFGVEKSKLIISVIPAVLWIAMAWVLQPVVAVLLFLLTDATGNMRDPIIADYQNRHIEGSRRATVLSMISLLTSGYIAIMLPIVGWIAGKSLPASFLFCAFLIITGLVFFRIRARDVSTTVEQ